MSRVIVKNLPPKTTEKVLSDLFSQCGEVTDARLMRTRAGLPRGFGFVGLASEAQARRAVETLDRSFVGAARISVEVAKPYGDGTLERPWSKYSEGSSAFAKREREKKRNRERGEGEARGGRGVKSGKVKGSDVLSELCGVEDEEEFKEFLSVHAHKSQVRTWADGDLEVRGKKAKKDKIRAPKRKDEGVGGEVEEGIGVGERKRPKNSEKVKAKVKENSETLTGSAGESAYEEDMEEEEEGEREEVEESCGAHTVTASSSGTDMDYLRSKVVIDPTATATASDSDNDDNGTTSESSSEGGEGTDSDAEGNEGEVEGELPVNQNQNEFSSTLFTLRMRGLPFKSKKEDVEAFFHPLSLADVRFTVDIDGRPSGRAYVDLNSEADLQEALKRDGDCIGKRYIELFRDEGPQSVRREAEPEEKREFGDRASEEEGETIADSGRLFLRNLSFTVSEDDLAETFERFGPLTEVTVPLDKNTNRPTGLGFVTFMLPEHAVRAHEAMDGQVFQGRLLHVLPARPRLGRQEKEGGEEDSGGSFKRKREREQKARAGSSHNWNSLFLGANSVVDAMARRYSTPKSAILDPESDRSAAVRVALGETQLVRETREFLEAEGVQLDVFEKRSPKRSLTVILAKNLPHGTKPGDLHDLFSPFGSLHKVILPPSGVSALMEFVESSHAKTAFKTLAYSKFKHLPLYLEWAPLGAVKKKKKKKEEEGNVDDERVGGGAKEDEREGEGEGKKENEGEEEGVGEGCTLFVKNLNFSSDEAGLKRVFSRSRGRARVEVARKRNVKDPSHPLSMGFGFVEFSTPQQAQQALKDLQHTELDGHRLELKVSHRSQSNTADKSQRKSAEKREQKSAKIMVRNIPFEASQREVRELFQTFGQLKTVRLPKKMAAMGRHRGFGFVEFMTRENAKRAFDSLCYSTHLYGRRLVLEWAEGEESVEEIRKRTADHFHGLQGAAANLSSKRRKAELLLYGNNRDKNVE